MMKLVIGVDPGQKGAIACQSLDRSYYDTVALPIQSDQLDAGRFFEIMDRFREHGEIVHAVVEKAIVLPKQGACSGFNMGINYGRLLALMEVAEVPFEEIVPASWKRAIIGNSGSKKRTKKDDPPLDPDPAIAKKLKNQQIAQAKRQLKEVAVQTARRMFPRAIFRDTQDGLAEALLMTEAARRITLTGSMSDEGGSA